MNNDADDYAGWPELYARLGRVAHSEYLAGQHEVLLHFVASCMDEGLVPPRWAREAFSQALHRWTDYEAATLGEAFQMKRPPGVHLEAQRRKVQEAFDIAMDVMDRRLAGVKAMDAYRQVAELRHTSVATVRRYWNINASTLPGFAQINQKK